MGDVSASIKKIYSDIAKKYSETYFGKEYVADKDIDMFISLLPKKAKLLDVGCGDGDYIQDFLNEGFEVEGIDISKDMMDIAKKRFPRVEFKVKDMRHLKLKRDSLDGIFAFQSLVHIPKKDCKLVLNEFYKGLKLKGLLFLALQEGDGEKYVYWPLAKDSIFINYYRLDEIQKELSMIGFEVIFSTRYLPLKEDIQNNKIILIAKKK